MGSVSGLGRSPGGGSMAIHSSILPWRIPWTENFGGQLSTGPQRVGLGWRDLAWTHTTFEELGEKAEILEKSRVLCIAPAHNTT